MTYNPGSRRSRLKRWALTILLAGILFAVWMYRNATADPIVRSTSVEIAGLSAPLRLVLLSDIHVAGPDMPPQRVRRIVDQINGLHPELVLIGGDFVSDKSVSTHQYSAAEAVAPLADLKSRLGVVAVMGNHDHWRDAGAIRAELRKLRITVLDNDAAQVGPLTIGGVDDNFTGYDNLPRALQRMRALAGPRVLLTHSPDVFPHVPADVALTLAGHTHCGQIKLPLIGRLATASSYGDRYACGRVDEGGRTLIVSAGLGTSLLPLRLGAPPDVWLIELRLKGN